MLCAICAVSGLVKCMSLWMAKGRHRFRSHAHSVPTPHARPAPCAPLAPAGGLSPAPCAWRGVRPRRVCQPPGRTGYHVSTHCVLTVPDGAASAPRANPACLPPRRARARLRWQLQRRPRRLRLLALGCAPLPVASQHTHARAHTHTHTCTHKHLHTRTQNGGQPSPRQLHGCCACSISGSGIASPPRPASQQPSPRTMRAAARASHARSFDVGPFELFLRIPRAPQVHAARGDATGAPHQPSF
ncbi:MAG: hypothetical protein J3K34DRAFT_197290 [Monoraphidium minutum]|nr:MAG: hypothetical protein J3K34DRAFT_197290 [Monoraphidium minutum]